MPNSLGLINNGHEVLRSLRRKSLRNTIRYISDEVKFKGRVGYVMSMCAGAGLSVGLWVGVFYK